MWNKRTMKVVIFGMQSTGKTALLTSLWNKQAEAAKENADTHIASYFDDINEGLENGNPLRSTTDGDTSKIANNRIPIILANPDKPKEIITFFTGDYMGENAERHLADEDNDLPAKDDPVWIQLEKSDGVLFLLDAYAVNQVKSLEKYCTDKSVFAKLSSLHERLSDRHRGGLPFCICFTRTDLISKKDLGRLEEGVKQIDWKTMCCGMKPIIKYISVFEKNKAQQPCAGESPSNDYLAPAEKINPNPGLALLFTLYNTHRRRKPRISIGKVVLITIAVMVSAAMLLSHTSDPDPKKELSVEVNRIIGVYTSLGANAISIADEKRLFGDVSDIDNADAPGVHAFKTYSDKFEENKKASNLFNAFYAKYLANLLMNQSTTLQFFVEDAKWRPEDIVAYLEDGLDVLTKLKRDDAVKRIREEQIKCLDKFKPEDQKSRENLADEYVKLGYPVPDKLKNLYSTQAREDLTDRISRLYLASNIVYEDLYAQNIPKELENVRSKAGSVLSVQFEKDIEELGSYLRMVTRTNSIDVAFSSLRIKGTRSEMEVSEFCLTVFAGDGKTVWEKTCFKAFPTEWASTVALNDVVRLTPLKWRPGLKYEVRIHIDINNFNDGKLGHDEWKTWRSGEYGRELREKNLDVPGLGFMIFKDMDLEEKKETVCWFWWNEYEFSYKLDIKKQGVWQLFDVPKLLIEANRKRKKG